MRVGADAIAPNRLAPLVFVLTIVATLGVYGFAATANSRQQTSSATVSSTSVTSSSSNEATTVRSSTATQGNGASSSSTSTTGERPPSAYSVTAPSGLELDLDLNATTIGVGSALGAQITFFNPLDQNISVPVANSPNPTIAAWTNDDFVCDGNSMYSLAAYALFQGRYSEENVSSAGTPLLLAPPVALSCIGQQADSVVFLPDSSNASLGGEAGLYRIATNATTEYCGDGCPAGTSLFGYWAPVEGLDLGEATTSSPYFHYLSPGQYTLVVEDEWNQTIYAPFQVSATSKNHIGAVSVTMKYGQEGREVSVSLENVGSTPIASLNASLTGFPTAPTAIYSFVFNASTSDPLLAGQSVQSVPTLVGAGIDTTKQYPLTVTGTLLNGTQFSYAERVGVVLLGQN
jgi:hypothetical protein